MENARPPELIITLSRDKVDVHLLENTEKGLKAWQSLFSIEGMHLEEQVAMAMDSALTQNPELTGDFNCVYLIVRDGPNLHVPSYIHRQGRMSEVAARYLRVRAGDTLEADDLVSQNLICYTLPRETMNVMREYYHTIDSIHLITLLWSEIIVKRKEQNEIRRIGYYALLGHQLVVIAAEGESLVFSKQFELRSNEDAVYFILACDRLLRAELNCTVFPEGEQSQFTFPAYTIFRQAQQMNLPAIPVLLMKHFPCAL